MTLENILSTINNHLISAFAELDHWFDQDEEFLTEKFSAEWCPAEILEHVMLTNHYLLVLVEKGSIKARNKAGAVNLSEILSTYCFETDALDTIAKPGAFVWDAPAHMVPTGEKKLTEIRRELRNQLYRCLCQLDLLAKGEGVLHKITMSVNDLGKLDVYQYLYFLALHIRRHNRQLEDKKYCRQLALAHFL
jgi:hypothetical protein